jgi:preprotein translocase subunit SecA
VERRVLLSILDQRWREHLYEMDYLQEGIGLRAMGQRDPLVEYQREGFDMFLGMQASIKEDFVKYMFHVAVTPSEEPQQRPEQTLVAEHPDAPEAMPDGPKPTLPVLEQQQQPPQPSRLQFIKDQAGTGGGGAAASQVQTVHSEKVGRNDPCPCGSGQKYKRCHGA